MSPVLEHYNKFGKAYCERAVSIDMKDIHDRFLKYLNKGARILDAGCGPGRDTKAFLERGFLAYPIDGSEEVVKFASEYLQKEVVCLKFEEMDFTASFDAIWSNASLLHIDTEQLKIIFNRFIKSLRSNGYWFMSFKYGTGSFKSRIPFYFQTEDSLQNFLKQFPELDVKELWVDKGINARHESTDWLYCIVKKHTALS